MEIEQRKKTKYIRHLFLASVLICIIALAAGGGNYSCTLQQYQRGFRRA